MKRSLVPQNHHQSLVSLFLSKQHQSYAIYHFKWGFCGQAIGLQGIFDPPTSPEYTPHMETLKASGRMINTTAADGNCMFRSLSKGLLGSEKYHYRIRTTLFGFIYGNSKFFLPHIEQKYNCSVEIRQYCLSMDKSGIWGTEIELLAAATMLQAPVYTYTHMGSTGTYWWSKFHPLAPSTNIMCDCDAGVRSLLLCPNPLTGILSYFTLVGATMTSL